MKNIRSGLFLALGLAVGAVVGYLLSVSPTQAESQQVPAWLEVAQRVCTSVGGLGSFAALILVIFQNNLAQRTMRASLDGQLYDRLDSFNKSIVDHAPEYAMLGKRFEDVEPSGDRCAKLHHLCEQGLTFFEQVYKHLYRYKLLYTEDWDEWLRNMKHFFAKPYVRGYWLKVRDRYAQSFRDFADKHLFDAG